MLDSNTDSAGQELHAPELVVRDTTASK